MEIKATSRCPGTRITTVGLLEMQLIHWFKFLNISKRLFVASFHAAVLKCLLISRFKIKLKTN
jgi:hypothetical protein